VRALFGALLALLTLAFVAPAMASEQIDRFDVVVNVERSGDIIVTETIDVTAEGVEIRRGIFRDLPRYYETAGDRLRFHYDVLSVKRDGEDERYETSTEGNAFRIRIGDADALLTHGAHEYELRYRVKNQVRYFDSYDELYWNATGNYWAFPIARARASIVLPSGARITATHGYTGIKGQTGADYSYAQRGDAHVFETTRALEGGEGLTVAVGFEKGLIDPPSSADVRGLWWQRNGALAVMLATLGGLFWFLYRGFERVGRDPTKPPVFPRYEPPAGHSPAAAHYIYYRGLRGHRALIATLMNLAVKGRLTIDASDKDATSLMSASPPPDTPGVAPEDLALEEGIFGSSTFKSLGGQYDAGFTVVYTLFRRQLSQKYGNAYFRWNVGYTLVAVLVSILVVAFALTQASQWTLWDTLGVLALAALNGAFMYLMPAPTQKGQAVHAELEGFRLYMETAEKLQLNAVEVGGGAPPPMTTERYETFLPYAVALGVEAPWTKHFERLIPEEAARYSPVWTNMGAYHSMAGLSDALVSNMSSGVTSAMPQSSSSSGSGGGGSSGGGGGGGGGGGW
jgi:uncharacterized membrane protein YgcG